MALRFPSIQRPIKALGFLALAFFLLHSFHLLPLSGRPYDTWTWTPCPPGSSPFKESCNIPRASIGHDVQIVVKTGGSEPLGRLRYQLKTLLSEVPRENLLILSDLEEDVGEYHIHDIYADVSEKERKNYPEFTLYDEQLVYKAQGKDTRELKGGWQLDKYKNLPMKRKIWKMQQEHIKRKKWFIFIDTDTYVEWDNLFGLLDHLDSSDELYMGSPVWITETNPDFKFEFAHGGSAYVLSYGALEALNTPESYDIESPMYSQYGLNVTALCCGDEAVSRVLLKKGIRMKGYWPLFNGEIPATAPYGKEHWCEPVISLHHIGEENLDALWHWILDWKHKTMNQQPLLWKDLFEYVSPQFSSRRDDWDNIENLDTKLDAGSFEDCKAACKADKLCFQFVFHGKTCELSHSIRFGRPHETDNKDDRYFSGWDMERIRDWTSKTKCKSAHWVRSNP